MKGTSLLSGAVGGLVATVPMTAVMLSLHRQLPARQRYPLPPRRITMRAAGEARLRHKLDEDERTAATYAAHFGYGTATGAVYGAVAPGIRAHPIVKGTTYGLLVWALSYLGLLPATGLHPPATREPGRRNALMILAHVVWGSVLGVVTESIRAQTRGDRRLRAAARR